MENKMQKYYLRDTASYNELIKE